LKRIVIFYEELVSTGGAERLAIEETKYFSEKVDTRLLTFKFNELVLSYAGGKLPSLSVIAEPGESSKADEYVRKGVPILKTLRRSLYLASALASLRPDIVVGVTWGGWLELFLASLFTRTPYVLHVHGTTFLFREGPAASIKYSVLHRSVFAELRAAVRGHSEFVSPKAPKGTKRLTLEVLSILDALAILRAKEVIVLSEMGKREVTKLYGRVPTKVTITAIPSCLPSPTSDVKKKLGIDGKRMIFTVGRVEKSKRVDVLIKAFAIISRSLVDVRLVIGGRGPEVPSLKRLALDLGVEDKVLFMGFIPEGELGAYYAGCDVFAFPGWADYVQTIYEALGYGSKVVCSSEIEVDNWMRSTNLVFGADPTPEEFAYAMKGALDAERVGLPPGRVPTWRDYAESVFKICERAARRDVKNTPKS
jgi:glycosyltransferase involved in cell wall biosynthesis